MTARKITAGDVRKILPRRAPNSHKGDHGHVLVIAGSRGMGGAGVLAALGALRAGAGLVTLASPARVLGRTLSRLPEALTLPLPETPAGALDARALPVLAAYLRRRRVNVVAVGPGLSSQVSVRRLVRTLLKTWDLPLVLDADGLNAISPSDLRHGRHRVITPHPGEFARLFGVSRQAVQSHRVEWTRKAARGLGIVCLLKGRGTVVSDGRRTRINPTGSAVLAAGGMGDVLTGVLAGFLAQGAEPFEAACAAAYLHGLAADLARVSDRGLLASEVAKAIPCALQKVGVR